MHVLELPLSFLYQLHPKHQVAMGAKLAYVFGIQTSSAMIDNMPANDLGFSSLDLGALAAYEYSINEHFAVKLNDARSSEIILRQPARLLRLHRIGS